MPEDDYVLTSAQFLRDPEERLTEPERNGVIERFMRTLREPCLIGNETTSRFGLLEK
jgi:hypothetical protein